LILFYPEISYLWQSQILKDMKKLFISAILLLGFLSFAAAQTGTWNGSKPAERCVSEHKFAV